MELLQSYTQYITDWIQNWKLRHRLGRRLRAMAPDYTALARAVEDRMVRVLRLFPRRPMVCTVQYHERLDPLDTSHGTWNLGLRAARAAGLGVRPGDMVYLAWENRSETVDEILRLLETSGRETIRLRPQPSLYQPRLPRTVDLRTALTTHLDCEMASIKLLRWADLEEAAAHNETQDRDHEVYHARVMETLDWSLPHPPYKPLHYTTAAVLAHGLAAGKRFRTPRDFIDLLEPCGGRAYTITGFNRGPGRSMDIDITVSQIFRQVEQPAGPRQVIPSRGSHYLLGRRPGDHIRGWILPDSHNLLAPVSKGLPTIVICNGSGISGFLALARTATPVPPLWLVYGVRSWERKGLYRRELEGYLHSGRIAGLDIAVSRPGEGEGPRRHVQDVLWEQRAAIADRLRAGAAIFVCGGQSMGDQVRLLVRDILVDQGLAIGTDSAETLLRTWEATLRYQASVSGI